MSTLKQSVEALEALYERALTKGRKRFVGDDGRVNGKKLNQEQLAAHGLAYLATETMAARQLLEWADTCGKTEQAVSQDVTAVTRRPPVVENHVLSLLQSARSRGLTPHVLTMACDDYESVLQETGEVDYEKMLGLIKRKLAETASRVWDHRHKARDERTILLYGGSLHNDLYPYEGLEGFSYATDVAGRAGDGYVEVDLYVPEYIEGNELLTGEPWYPAFERHAGPDRVVLIERGPRSYILILRKGLAPGRSPGNRPAPARPGSSP